MAGAVVTFVLSLTLTLISSVVLVRLINMVGHRFDLPEGLFGILTALAANSPEIAAAVSALHSGKHDVGVGVILGSNLCNIAALLGLSAIVAGNVRILRRPLVLNGAVALVVTSLATLLVLGILGATPALVTVVAVLAPYVAVLSVRPVADGDETSGKHSLRRLLSVTAAEQAKESRPTERPRKASNLELLTLIPVITAVVLGSVELVDASVRLGRSLQIGQSLIGALVLGPLTDIPNAIAAVSLARKGRGSAVVSEALNSNSLNVVVGLCLPAVVIGTARVTPPLQLEAWWLLGLTGLSRPR